MDRTELTLIIGFALVIAVIIGWGLRWFFDKLNTSGPIASDEAVARMRAAEAEKVQVETSLAELQQSTRGVELALQSEVEAAMAGLGNARREAETWRGEAEAWRTEIEELRKSST